MPSPTSRLRQFALTGSFLATTLLAVGFTGLQASAQDAAAPAEAPAAEAPAETTVAVVDEATIEAGFEVWKGSDCVGCHGWAGNGERIGENPEGPNLRAVEMEAEFLKEVILCGRPGTQMPSHDPRAYSDGRCYGMMQADLEGLVMLEGKPMTSAEADLLVAYMEARMIGRPEQAAKEDCEAYYGARPFCANLPTLAEQGITQ